MEIKDYYDKFSDAYLNEYGSLIQQRGMGKSQ